MLVINWIHLVAVTLALVIWAAVASACQDEPTTKRQRHDISLAEIRTLLAESEERSDLIFKRLEQQARQARPDLREAERLACAFRREHDIWRELYRQDEHI